MRIAIDAMGGDHAPGEIIKGVMEARELLEAEDELVLIGAQATIEKQLAPQENGTVPIRVVDAPESIGMDESPVDALRKKRDSSIAVMARMAAQKEVDAVISAGNTGACVAAFQIRMRNLEGVTRPGIAVILPTLGGPSRCVMSAPTSRANRSISTSMPSCRPCIRGRCSELKVPGGAHEHRRGGRKRQPTRQEDPRPSEKRLQHQLHRQHGRGDIFDGAATWLSVKDSSATSFSS